MERIPKRSTRQIMSMENCTTPKVNLVRYADDFIVTADRKETLLGDKGNKHNLLKERRTYTIREDTDNTHQ